MTTQEKAKRYDEALRKAKDVYTYYCDDREQLRKIESIFPELQSKESEDELTWLTNYIEEEAYYLSMDIRDNEDKIKLQKLQKSLAWLKKQGEQEPIMDIPKFKVGEWITNGQYNKLIVGINSAYHFYIFKDGTTKRIKDADNHYHLWTIKDARDGDILVHSSLMFDDFIFIYNNTSLLQAYCYYYKQINKIVIEDRSHPCPWNMQEVTPATKEQRELLFQKIEEAGYKWDTGNKQLIKLL